jgi:uncharacterized protein YdaU (DUF1376 family)
MVEQKADTWMPLYVADYLADTLHLSTEQHGAYLLMLMACWKSDGSLPGDDAALASITKLQPRTWVKHRDTLTAFFRRDGKRLVHKRVMEERERARQTSEARSESGKKAAAARWQTHSERMRDACDTHSERNASAVTNVQQNDTPSPSPKEQKQKPCPADAGRFAEFWAEYPRHEAKRQALDVWHRKRLDAKADVLIADVKRRKAEHRPWLDGYVPHPATYLRGERWDDAIDRGEETQTARGLML